MIFIRIYQILTGKTKKGMPQNSDIPFSFHFSFMLFLCLNLFLHVYELLFVVVELILQERQFL